MFSTLSYCFGFTSHELNSNSSKEIDSPAFITEDVEDQWTLVELDDSSNDKENDKRIGYPTPSRSPSIEQSWVITPPPCFNAEVRLPVEELSPMENLLIEHPSIFIKSPLSNFNKKTVTKISEKPSKVTVHQPSRERKMVSARSKRKKTIRKSMAAIRKTKNLCTNSEFKRRNLMATRCSAAGVRKRERVIRQPRKNY